MLLIAVLLTALFALGAAPAIAQDGLLSAAELAQAWGDPHAWAIYGGIATNEDFTADILTPWTNEFKDMGLVGLAGSVRLGTLDDLDRFIGIDLGSGDDDFSIEGEAGAGYRFGEEDIGELWTGLYLRYHDLPWNDVVYTTVAVNTGVSLLFEQSDFERRADKNGEASKLLHFLGPEITFASPNDKNREIFLRIHHRSGVFGAFDGVTNGSTFIAIGFRRRF